VGAALPQDLCAPEDRGRGQPAAYSAGREEDEEVQPTEHIPAATPHQRTLLLPQIAEGMSQFDDRKRKKIQFNDKKIHWDKRKNNAKMQIFLKKSSKRKKLAKNIFPP
jgi:hypothetical protein